MRIVITADTHMPDKAKQLPERLTNELAKADQIIHAGDWKTMDVYEELSQYGKVTGVYGNVDDTALQEHLNARETITINGYKLVWFMVTGRKNDREAGNRSIYRRKR